jgi:hypothetical protein
MPLNVENMNQPENTDNQRDIDKIVRRVKLNCPEAIVEQLKVTHEADDDGLWYFFVSGRKDDEIQIESSKGMCPFLIESSRNGERRYGKTVDDVVTLLLDHLKDREIDVGKRQT